MQSIFEANITTLNTFPCYRKLFSFPSISVYLFRNYWVIRAAVWSLVFNFHLASHLEILAADEVLCGSISASSSPIKWILLWKMKINGLHNESPLLIPIWIKRKGRERERECVCMCVFVFMFSVRQVYG